MAITTNYEDERLTQVEADKNQAMDDLRNQYDQMINESDQYYNEQIQASKDWAEQQQQIQQEQTDFAIEQVEQQREKTEKDYLKEQSGAYVDYQKQSGKYGANAEQMAANGLQGTGFSESSQVSMYNTYQNRVATARESLNQANMNFDNAIQQARLQNNAKQAEIALEAYQKQLELSLQGFHYKNDLLATQIDKLQALDDTYHNRYQDVLDQINTENAMNEEIRQYEENLKLQREQLAEQIRQFNEEMARLKAEDERAHALELQQLELQRRQLEEEKRQYDLSLAEQKRQYNESVSKSQQQAQEEAELASNFGNSKATMARTDYYFSNGYQPRYVNNAELSKTGQKVSDVFGNSFGAKIGAQNIWKASDGHYYIWDGTSKDYIDVTSAFPSSSAGSGGKYTAYFK